jgi:hypothetical protein
MAIGSYLGIVAQPDFGCSSFIFIYSFALFYPGRLNVVYSAGRVLLSTNAGAGLNKAA